MNKPATEVRIRPASPTDLEAILTLERATESAPHWPLSIYTAILNPAIAVSAKAEPNPTPLRCLFVAESLASANSSAPTAQHPLLGFAVALMPPSTERIAELESVAVYHSARRRGIGRALCLAVLDWCRTQGSTSVLLEVRASSAPAIALYTSLGFLPHARRPLYYANPEDDALILSLTFLSEVLALHRAH